MRLFELGGGLGDLGMVSLEVSNGVFVQLVGSLLAEARESQLTRLCSLAGAGGHLHHQEPSRNRAWPPSTARPFAGQKCLRSRHGWNCVIRNQ